MEQGTWHKALLGVRVQLLVERFSLKIFLAPKRLSPIIARKTWTE
jgi:hypothetical protein